MPITVNIQINVPNGISFADANPDKNTVLYNKLLSFMGNGLISANTTSINDVMTARYVSFVYDTDEDRIRIRDIIKQMPEEQDRETYNTLHNITETISITPT